MVTGRDGFGLAVHSNPGRSCVCQRGLSACEVVVPAARCDNSSAFSVRAGLSRAVMLQRGRYRPLFGRRKQNHQARHATSAMRVGMARQELAKCLVQSGKKSSAMDSISHLGAPCSSARTGLKLWTRTALFHVQAQLRSLIYLRARKHLPHPPRVKIHPGVMQSRQ